MVFALDCPVFVQSLPPPLAEYGDPGARPTTRVIEARFGIDQQHSFGSSVQQCVGTSDSSDERALASLYCGSCNSVLIREGTLRRVLPLPSPFWHELADMWICHDDFKCRSEMANKSPADLRPRPGDCLFAEHHLMMHARDFVPGAIKWALADEDEDMDVEPGVGMAVERELAENKGGADAAQGPGSASNLCSAELPRLSSTVSSASSAASFSALGRGRLWEEVCCARCEGSLGEALVFSSSAKAQAAAAKSRAARGEAAAAGAAPRTSSSSGDLGDGKEGSGGDASAADGVGGQRGTATGAQAGAGKGRSATAGAQGGRGARGRVLHSRRQQGLHSASFEEDIWGGSSAETENTREGAAAATTSGNGPLGGAEADRQGDGRAQPRAAGLPASVQSLGGPKAGGDPEFDYARKGGVMVILDDGTALPWPVVQVREKEKEKAQE